MLFLQAKRAGKPFTPDAKRALASTNTMDRCAPLPRVNTHSTGLSIVA